MTTFDFAKYDIGGKFATAGDGKLTGAEVRKAQADGWNVWERFTKYNNVGDNNKNTSNILGNDTFSISDGKSTLCVVDGKVERRLHTKRGDGKKVDIIYEYYEKGANAGIVKTETHVYRDKIGNSNVLITEKRDPRTGKLQERATRFMDGNRKGEEETYTYDENGNAKRTTSIPKLMLAGAKNGNLIKSFIGAEAASLLEVLSGGVGRIVSEKIIDKTKKSTEA